MQEVLKKPIHSLYASFTILILLLVDSSLFFLFEQQVSYFLIAYFIVSLFRAPRWELIIFSILLCSIESLLFFNYFGLSLFYLFPIIYIVYRVKSLLYMNRLYPVACATGGLIIQMLLIEPFFLGIWTPLPYTIGKIIATLLTIELFSLKLFFRGKTGQSLKSSFEA